MVGKGDSDREEFRVVISGLKLSDEDRERLNRAVQQAALDVIGSFDFAKERSAAFFPISPGSMSTPPDWWRNPWRTWGIIWVGDFDGNVILDSLGPQ